jgi:GDP-L-fucose synthase
MLSHINVGSGVDCTIRELAETVAKVTGFKDKLVFDASKPDGTPRKLMAVSRLKAFWGGRQQLTWRMDCGMLTGGL